MTKDDKYISDHRIAKDDDAKFLTDEKTTNLAMTTGYLQTMDVTSY
jgi:hypothetical protein